MKQLWYWFLDELGRCDEKYFGPGEFTLQKKEDLVYVVPFSSQRMLNEMLTGEPNNG